MIVHLTTKKVQKRMRHSDRLGCVYSGMHNEAFTHVMTHQGHAKAQSE